LGAGWRVEVRDLALGNAPLLPGAQRANVGVFHELRPPGAVFAAALTGTRADMLDALAAGGSTGRAVAAISPASTLQPEICALTWLVLLLKLVSSEPTRVRFRY